MICKKTRNNYKKIYIYGFTKKYQKTIIMHMYTLHKKKTFLGAQCGVLDM